MQSVNPEPGDQAIENDCGDLVTVQYQAHRDALKFIHSALRSSGSVGVLHGTRSSGKTTIVRRVKDAIPDRTAVALINGTDIRPRGLLSAMLAQYGYNTGLQSTRELLQMVRVFAMQQAQSTQAPILIIDNVEHMYPSALRTLNSLATLTVQQRFAIRILLTGCEGLSPLIASADMTNIAKRNVGIFTIGPMSGRETMLYLHAQLTARGIQQPYEMFPADLCNRLRELSGGWPGLIDHYAQEAVSPERPRLILTRNGTTVNSVTTSSTILQGNDIISIGSHRLKVVNAPTLSAEMAERINTQDTVKMKNLMEMRRLKEERRVAPVKEKQRD